MGGTRNPAPTGINKMRRKAKRDRRGCSVPILTVGSSAYHGFVRAPASSEHPTPDAAQRPRAGVSEIRPILPPKEKRSAVCSYRSPPRESRPLCGIIVYPP
jgi:hypothetical protein